MIKKALAVMLFAMTLGVYAQGDRLENVLKIEKVSGLLGSYWERTDYQADGLDDYEFGTAFLGLYAETGKVGGLNFGAEMFAHMQLWNHGMHVVKGTARDPYDFDIEPQAKESLSRLFLQYTQDDLVVQAGRIGDMKVTHLDDNRYEGAIAKFKAGEKVVLSGGVIRGFGEIDYDDAEEMTYFNRLATGAADALVFGEARVEVCPGLSANPYVYWHHDYASVYGLDTDTHISLGDKKSIGLLAQGYMVNSELSTATVQDDADVWHLGLYAKLGALSLNAGEIQLDGSGNADTDMNRPKWFRDYMPINDQTQFSVEMGARTYYGMAKLKIDKWWTSLFVGKIDSLNGQYDDVELQVGYSITKALDVNLRFINVESTRVGQDYFKHEGRIQYKF